MSVKADNTRGLILKKAFDLTYAHGYQLTSIDDIIAQTHVTKGAFYYHFRNKDTMGIAMIKEVLYPGMQDALVKPLMAGRDPVAEIYDMMEALLLHNPFFNIKYGCPAINLIEEMASVNRQFHKALLELVEEWQNAIAATIEKGKKTGRIDRHVSGKQVAIFISAGYGGTRNMGKLYGRPCYLTYLKELKKYLNSLR
ncbi:MAG TPA: TetR/AcrR family transcriptional regulator [Cyclobacteriaceae bacterium]|nr:TetR/AcrR family transcriptional regulator [Cyclobacteriaceae bacterium]